MLRVGSGRRRLQMLKLGLRLGEGLPGRWSKLSLLLLRRVSRLRLGLRLMSDLRLMRRRGWAKSPGLGLRMDLNQVPGML